jgi:phosphatidylinositol-3-phosphatase
MCRSGRVRDNDDLRRLLVGGAVLGLLLVAGASALAVSAGLPLAAERGVGSMCGRRARPPAKWRHVVWIWMENASFGEIMGGSSAPSLQQFARQCGLATNYHAITHPSLPNYIAATSGSDWKIRDDEPPASHALPEASIFSQLTAAGMSWRSYEESMPSNCARSSSGLYAVKHNPAAYYIPIRGQCRERDVPMGTTSSGRLLADLQNDRLPSFSLLTPNLCDDMHSCPIAIGDAWLRRWVTEIVGSTAYRSSTTVVFVTFDEGSARSNRVVTLVISPTTPPGTKSSTSFDHYSLLKTTEQLLGVPTRLGHAADASTLSMRTGFHL